mgnify:CR=1 FL=1
MNSTYPKDGKQHRQSQNYVPTGPITPKTYWLECSVADVNRELGKFGNISVLYERSTYNSKLFRRESAYKKARQRNKILPIRNAILNVPLIKITFSTDHEGHCLAYDAMCGLSDYIAQVRAQINRQNEEDIEPSPTNRPTIVKRLTGKERKIAKKRAAEKLTTDQNEESS